MTRINCGIPVEELCDKHLLSEHREIKRIPNAVAKGRYNIRSVPAKFVMGTGHVAFFYDKLLYLRKRYLQIYQECIKRNFNVQSWLSAWDGVPSELMNDYEPSDADRALIRERISERLNGS